MPLKPRMSTMFLFASGVIAIVTLSPTKNLARFSAASFFPVLKVLVFHAVGVPDKVAPVSKYQNENGLNVFLSWK